jgi:hypothetical protein
MAVEVKILGKAWRAVFETALGAGKVFLCLWLAVVSCMMTIRTRIGGHGCSQMLGVTKGLNREGGQYWAEPARAPKAGSHLC